MLYIKRNPADSSTNTTIQDLAKIRIFKGLGRFGLQINNGAEGPTRVSRGEVEAVIFDLTTSGPKIDIEHLDEIDTLRSCLDAGINVLVFEGTTHGNGAVTESLDRLSSSTIRSSHAESEWFLIPTRSRVSLSERLSPEIDLSSEIVTYEAGGGAEVLVEVSIGFRHFPVVVAKSIGAANLIRIGLNTSAAPRGDLSRLLARLATYHPQESQEPKTTLGVGVVGYGPFGGMGHFHGSAANATDGLKFVAAVDPDPHRRRAAEAEFPGIRTYADVSELAADAEVDIAIVATPPTSHYSIATSLLKSSKHVAVEKPMAITTAEADEMIALSQEYSVTLTVNQNRRWDQDYRAVRKIVSSGRIGEVFNIETFVGGFEHPCRAWHSDETVSGGAAYDWGAHHIDWILQLIPELPVAVSATGHKRVWNDITNLDQIRLRLHYASGKEAEFFQSDIAGFRKPKFFIQGTAGTVVGNYRPLSFETISAPLGYQVERYHHAEAPANLRLATYVGPDGLEEADIPLPPPDKFGFHRNLANHLILAEPLEVSPVQVREVIRILEAGHRSSKSGGITVEL